MTQLKPIPKNFQPLSMRGKVLITGGTGYVGGWVLESLLNAGYEVTNLGRKAHSNPNVESLIACITDREALQEALSNRYFDTVLHLAAANQLADEETIELVNVKGTQNLIVALQRAKPKLFIYLSTIKVYGPVNGRITEHSVPNLIGSSAYGRSKLAAEKYLLGLPVDWDNTRKVSLRLSNAYGAPKNADVDAWHLLFNNLSHGAFARGEIILKSPPDTQLDMIWLGSVCQVILKAISNNSITGIYNLGSGTSVTIGAVAEAVAFAYRGYFGKELTINKPETVGNIVGLKFDCGKLQSQVPYDTHPYFESQVIEIFKLLTTIKP
jgi:UDP-glucose 4-epimerase